MSRGTIGLFIRTGVVFVLAASAWAGILMSGMRPLWALACSAIGGAMALFVGMVLSGVKYHNDMEAVKRRNVAETEEARKTYEAVQDRSVKKLESLYADLEGLRRDVARQRREFGVAAVVMAKAVADNVAAKIVARHSANLPAPEHVEAAMRDAADIVASEIMAYGDTLRKGK